MVLAAYHADKTAFDGLWKFAKSMFMKDGKLDPSGLMSWKVTFTGFSSDTSPGTATDGDTDIGFALVAAVDQWGEAYRQPALDYLAALKRIDYATCPSGRVMARAGDWDNGACPAHSNSSYWMPGYYRVFAAFTGDSFWSKAADDALALLAINQNEHTTGFVANEISDTGADGSGQAYVDYNGCRVPWRTVLDYLWFGTAQAKKISDKMTTWVDGIGIANTVDGYNTDGTPTGGWKNGSDCWVGGFATGAMSSTQDRVDRFASDFEGLTIDNYYETSLRSLYMLMLSGAFWQPGGSANVDGGAAPTDGGVGTHASDAGADAAGHGGVADGGGGEPDACSPASDASDGVCSPASDAGAGATSIGGCNTGGRGHASDVLGWFAAIIGACSVVCARARRRRTDTSD